MTAPEQLASPSLTPFDWALVIIVVVSAAMAFRSGFVRVLFSFGGMIAGFVAAGIYYERLGHWLNRWMLNKTEANGVAFLAILFAVVIAFGVAAGFARQGVKALGLGFMDRVLGAAIGALRGAMAAIAVLVVMVAFTPHSSWLKGSTLAPYFLAGSHAVSFVVPQHLQDQMSEGTKHLLKNPSGVLKPSAVQQ